VKWQSAAGIKICWRKAGYMLHCGKHRKKRADGRLRDLKKYYLCKLFYNIIFVMETIRTEQEQKKQVDHAGGGTPQRGLSGNAEVSYSRLLTARLSIYISAHYELTRATKTEYISDNAFNFVSLSVGCTF
jgi:hypothetical protein